MSDANLLLAGVTAGLVAGLAISLATSMFFVWKLSGRGRRWR